MAPQPAADLKTPEDIQRLPGLDKPHMSKNPPRFLVIGAGSRGHAYAKNIAPHTNGILAAVCDPLPFARKDMGKKYIWTGRQPLPHEQFQDWTDFVKYEEDRRARAIIREDVEPGVDGVFICVQDELHMPVILGLKHLDLHIMCEKPLATNLEDCVKILTAVMPEDGSGTPKKIFSIGHVLRYSPHNMLLRKLLLEDRVIGDILSINHTEPVGWWHFAHSYVRGNWRNSSFSAPSLLTKSCHDIDVLLWLLCSPPPNSTQSPHLPAAVTSSGARQFFTRRRKPATAGSATNCLSCAHEPDCMFSARKIYLGDSLKGLKSGNTGWPVKILVPDIEDCLSTGGMAAGEKKILESLAEDWDERTPKEERRNKQYYGRCVFDGDNDVNDDQIVQLLWEDDEASGQGAKNATFHMVAMTAKICQRYTHIYGTTGEVYADSEVITVTDFTKPIPLNKQVAKNNESAAAFETRKFYPQVPEGGHGGGDAGLTRQFVLAVDRVKNGEDAAKVQQEEIGCDVVEVVRSHALCFAAEEARRRKKVIDFPAWWRAEVESKLKKQFER